jgi:hypothetical protein
VIFTNGSGTVNLNFNNWKGEAHEKSDSEAGNELRYGWRNMVQNLSGKKHVSLATRNYLHFDTNHAKSSPFLCLRGESRGAG